MDFAVIKKLIEEDVICFEKMLLKHYKSIGLSEIEAFILATLHQQRKEGETFISPSKLAKKMTLEEQRTLELLDSLMQRKYIQIRLIKQQNNKETEDFSLDPTIEKLIKVYQRIIKQEITETNKIFDTVEEEVVDLLENQFQKQLKPLEIELIHKWLQEDHYTIEDVKRAIIDAVKANKSSISYVDGVLLKRSKMKKKAPKKTYKPEKSEALKAFYDSWDKK